MLVGSQEAVALANQQAGMRLSILDRGIPGVDADLCLMLDQTWSDKQKCIPVVSLWPN